MSTAAAHANAFYEEIRTDGLVFTVKDEGGFPAPRNGDGVRAMPFWSKRSRAQAIVDTVPAYSDFQVVELQLDDWTANWLPGLERDGLRLGLNWSGPRATGYDVSVSDFTRNLVARLEED
ncbi:DUF2750 domain-containing protein [Oryzihumus leptocrescens]|uniref:Uncharacterized protein DUF2750 n=1 Tax=Oryzihumus leptocrescens TaxID=297536 RepID=A0A542ZEM4_9MICO|nr:DUF2750 domain-containing protein [Oryzihumus leptocrescens]TQL58785.1 uncharacterized protein DUF2750 [Oryzihumus leptocrescens]